MQNQNWKNIGDAPLPPDTSERDEARSKAVDAMKIAIVDEWMQDPVQVAESRGFFTTSEDEAIEAAIIAGDAMKVGQLTIAAVRRVLAVQAEPEAWRRFSRIEREDLIAEEAWPCSND